MEEKKAITVAEMIEKLKALPQDAECYVAYDFFYVRPIDGEDYPCVGRDGMVCVGAAG